MQVPLALPDRLEVPDVPDAPDELKLDVVPSLEHAVSGNAATILSTIKEIRETNYFKATSFQELADGECDT